MKRNSILLTLLLSAVLYNCDGSKQDQNEKKATRLAKDSTLLAEGAKLVENQCYNCHRPNENAAKAIAPSMEIIKAAYLADSPSLKEFKKSLSSFLTSPKEGNSKLPDAVEEYGLMSRMYFPDEEIERIAAYLYAADFKSVKNAKTEDETPLSIGKSLALEAKNVLGKNLMKAIKAHGAEYAVSFCSTRAIHLTDSVARSVNARIKRASDKHRNPNNKANEREMAYIKEVKEALSKSKKPKPQLITEGDKHVGYYPILTNNMCLQCHGTSSDINPETRAKIESLYPNDLATGYGPGELRGIWVVEFNRDK